MTAKEKQVKKNKQRFLKAIKKSRGHINNACAIAGISRMTLSNYRRDDAEFSELCEEAVYEQKSRFGEDLTQAFVNKTLGERKELLDKDGNPILDEDGEPIYEYMGGDTVAMIWASKNTPMMNGQSWSDKQQLSVDGGNKIIVFEPARSQPQIEEAIIVEDKDNQKEIDS